MKEINDGGPAFPVLDYRTPDRAEHKCDGMSLRDYFAAKAMQGMLASGDAGAWEQFAERAYTVADAMIAEGSK